jgi:hypothetical protein
VIRSPQISRSVRGDRDCTGATLVALEFSSGEITLKRTYEGRASLRTWL